MIKSPTGHNIDDLMIKVYLDLYKKAFKCFL